jgi:hypothetical protein
LGGDPSSSSSSSSSGTSPPSAGVAVAAVGGGAAAEAARFFPDPLEKPYDVRSMSGLSLQPLPPPLDLDRVLFAIVVPRTMRMKK